MKLPLFQIDAFTNVAFKGNPAAVVPLQTWLPDADMQAVATENNLSETAFFVRNPDGKYAIRWFSPLKEIAFCGHATLASAHMLFTQQGIKGPITFWARAVGDLTVSQLPDGRIEMSFPNRAPVPLRPDEIPAALLDGLPIKPTEVLKNQQAYIVVFEDEHQVRTLSPNLAKLAELGPLDVAATAPGIDHDFVSRYFWPANGGDEDPVTGSIHAGLAPYWAGRLNKSSLTALQASRRSGIVHCRVQADRVYVSGSCVQYLEGTIYV